MEGRSMTKEEISKFVESLPNVYCNDYFPSPAHPAGKDKYLHVVAKEGHNRKEYLLNTGEVVKGTERTESRRDVESYLGNGCTYLGIGILHKRA